MAQDRKNGSPIQPAPQPAQTVEPMTIFTHPRFRWDVEVDHEGNVVLAITKPNLEQHLLPLGREQATALGRKLIAPRVNLP